MVFLSVSVSVTVSAGSVRSVCESMLMSKPASASVPVPTPEIVSSVAFKVATEPWWLRGLIEHTQFLTLKNRGFEPAVNLSVYGES